MPLKSGITTALIKIQTTDTVLLNPGDARFDATLANAYEQSGNAEEITFYYSDDGTSASGEEILTTNFAANEAKSPIELLGGVADGKFLLAKATSTSDRVAVKITYDEYTGDAI